MILFRCDTCESQLTRFTESKIYAAKVIELSGIIVSQRRENIQVIQEQSSLVATMQRQSSLAGKAFIQKFQSTSDAKLHKLILWIKQYLANTVTKFTLSNLKILHLKKTPTAMSQHFLVKALKCNLSL